MNNVWEKAKGVKLNISKDLSGEFDYIFDKKCPEELQLKMINFMEWVEDNYGMPVVLDVDFEYKNYLVDSEKRRVGYLFYYNDFKDYPNIASADDIPALRLPIKDEEYSLEEILGSFIEALTLYYAWVLNELTDDFVVDDSYVDYILEEYMKTVK